MSNHTKKNSPNVAILGIIYKINIVNECIKHILSSIYYLTAMFTITNSKLSTIDNG